MYNVGMEDESTKNLATPEEAVGKEIFDVSISQAHKSQQGWHEGFDSDILMDALIAEWCANDPCAAQKLLDHNKMLYTVEYLADNLPAVQFVGQFYLELIIHGGLIAKDKYNQEKLDEWLLHKNPYGQTNENVIRQALLSSIIYGYSGLRDIMGNLVYVAPNHFRIWRIPATAKDPKTHKERPIPGIKAPVLYEIRSKRDKSMEAKENDRHVFDESESKKYTLDQVVKTNKFVRAVDGSYFENDDEDGAATPNVFVPVKHFCHLRHSDEGSYGKSPLATDRLRTTLIIDYIKNVIDEVSNDGNDYIMYLKQRGVAGTSLSKSLSEEAQNKTLTAAQDPKVVKSVRERQMEAARSLAKKLKRTAKTRIGIVSKDWVDEITRLEGTVRLPDYLTVLNDAKGVVADIYGIPAMLAGSSGGGWSTGMSALIPFTLERTIKPFQQRYANQLGEIIQQCAGVKGEIKFKEIDWGDEQTRAEIDKIKAETEKALAEANKAKVDSAKSAKETKLLTSDGVNGRNQNNQNNQSSTSTAKKTTPSKTTKKK